MAQERRSSLSTRIKLLWLKGLQQNPGRWWPPVVLSVKATIESQKAAGNL